LPSASGGGGVQIGNPTQGSVVLGAAVALGAAVVFGAARVVVMAGCGVVALAVAVWGRDGEDDEHAARPKTAAKITQAFTFATRTPSVTSKDRFTRYGGDGKSHNWERHPALSASVISKSVVTDCSLAR
jgi:hypothetical protein